MRTFLSGAEAAAWLKSKVPGTLHADSRKIQPGDGFIAWPGTAVDARSHVPGALQSGAAACLIEHAGQMVADSESGHIASYSGLKTDAGAIASDFFGNPSHALAVLAVTGTNGKTSTAWWLAQALSALPAQCVLPCGVIGTLGVGLPQANQVVPTGLTTPDPVLLQSTLRTFVGEGLKACAIEASSIGIEEKRLDGTRIRVAIFTNFTQDHLDYHGSMEAYGQAKKKLFHWPGLASAVVNIDDAMGEALAQELAAGTLDLWTVSVEKPARLQAQNIVYDTQGLRFDVVEGMERLELRSRMIGAFNVSNILGVIGAMRSLGIPLPFVIDACKALTPVPGRLECLGGYGEPLVAVDYAHTPDALGQALLALRPLAMQRNGDLWCLFGCGGDRDASKRPMMGAVAMQRADHVVVTSDNPRSEKPEVILSQILLGMSQTEAVNVQVDRALAIADVISKADAQDVILLAGKGHESTQEIAGIKHLFSDAEHAAAALQLRRRRDSGFAA